MRINKETINEHKIIIHLDQGDIEDAIIKEAAACSNFKINKNSKIEVKFITDKITSAYGISAEVILIEKNHTSD